MNRGQFQEIGSKSSALHKLAETILAAGMPFSTCSMISARIVASSQRLAVNVVENLYSERQLAKRWQTSTRTIQRMRANGNGPVYLRIGGAIRYRPEDILHYEAACQEPERGSSA